MTHQTKTTNGIDSQAAVLARLFMSNEGSLCRRFTHRKSLEKLYNDTMNTWMTPDIFEDKEKHRPFKNVLYALAHELKVVRVVRNGQTLKWNRYRDNEGNMVEREDSRREDSRREDSRREDSRQEDSGPDYSRRDYRRLDERRNRRQQDKHHDRQ